MNTALVNAPTFASGYGHDSTRRVGRQRGDGTYKGDFLHKRQRYEVIRAALQMERSSWDAHWRELAEFFLPRRSRFLASERNRGGSRNQKLIDSTPKFAARTLASGMHAGLTSPARPWMKLSTPELALSEATGVKQWLQIVTQRMRSIFATTNLYNALPTIYGDMGVFGTAALGIFEDREELFLGETFPIGSYACGTNARGIVDTFCQEVEFTIWQLVEKFGGPDGQPLEPGQDIQRGNFSQTVMTLWDRSDYNQTVPVCWLVMPNRLGKADAFASKDLPFSACYYEMGQDARDGGFLREEGFPEFPILVPRWDVTGKDAYGSDSPGITALGDDKGLQVLQTRKAQAVEKIVNPPLQAPSHLRNQKVSLLPGNVTYADIREHMSGIKPIHEVRPQIGELLEDVNSHQKRIERAFFADLFLMLAYSDGPGRMTAREVQERHEEKLLMLGPVLERTNHELLDPLVDRVFGMMVRKGLVPDPPPELEGVKLRVEYISLLHQAQKQVAVAAHDRFLQTVGALAGIWPEARHKVDPMQVVDGYADMLGVDPRMVRSDDEANALADAERQAMARAQAAQDELASAKTAQALGAAQVAPDTALGRMVDPAAQQGAA